jgi:tetratricopeptide (TPR) repeat protein
MARSAAVLLLGLLAATATAGAQADHQAHRAQPTDSVRLGTIVFPTSGRASAQSDFLRGVLYLHSFEYASAQRAFRRAEALDPDFAMAYWGEAMTATHPVWNEQDLAAGREALERLGATAELRRAKAKTPREQAYLQAVEALYGTGPKARRDTLYARAMEQVVRQSPTDLEAKAFYALALLGLNQGIRDTVTYLRAARYADTVYRANPEHPGAVHYLIHAYDDPLHAPLGLEAARAYARIARDAAHAQHMTTHIFLAMGMWDEVVGQNRIAVGATAEVPGHYTSWLLYGLIQQGKYDAAQAMLEQLRGRLSSDAPRGQHTYLAEMRAQFLLHSEAWTSPAATWKLDGNRMALLGQLIDNFSAGVIAFRRHDSTALANAAQGLGQVVEAIRKERGPDDPATPTAQVMVRELEGMGLWLSGSRGAAILALREAAALEDALPMEFGPPAIVEPSHEILGALLLETEPAAALAEYQRALVLAPGRSRALLGLARAAIATGDKSAAQRALNQLATNWRAADPKVREAMLPIRGLIEGMP